MTTGAGDGYIPARKGELAAKLTAEAGADAAGLSDFFRLLGAVLHFEAHDDLEALKALYDPLDPDAPPQRRDTSGTAFSKFENAFIEALTRANFEEIEADSVQSRDATKVITGLNIKPSEAGLRSVRFFGRGREREIIPVKSWFGLRTQNIEADVMDDIVVVVSFKGGDEISRGDRQAFRRMRRGVRPGAAIVKHFRNVAAPELVTLHPGARPSMRPRDQVVLGVPALAGGLPLLWNLWLAAPVIFAVLAAYIGLGRAVEDDELRHALAASSGLLAVGAFLMRQRMKFETQNLRYQKQLAETVYFRNLANNAGVLDLLVGAGEEQDCKEAFLAYGLLLQARHSMGRGELDMAAEQFLKDRLQIEVNFEIGDAIEKLERMGLIARDGDNYAAVPVREALAKLDAAWDGYFNFSARR